VGKNNPRRKKISVHFFSFSPVKKGTSSTNQQKKEGEERTAKAKNREKRTKMTGYKRVGLG